MPINLRRVGEVADGSVTTSKLADAAVTAVKAAGNIKTSYITSDDTTVYNSGTVWTNQKELRFVKKFGDIPGGEVIVMAEIMAGSGTANVGIFFDAEAVPRISLYTVGTGFELLEGTCYIGDLAEGVHSVNLSLRNSNVGASYNKLVEMHARA